MNVRIFWAVLVVVCLAMYPAAASALLVWDSDPATAGIQEGGGDWNTTNMNWSPDGGTTNVSWDNSNPTFAQFGVVESTSEVDIVVQEDGITATGLGFLREFRMQGPGTITLQGVDTGGGEKVAEIVANARCEFYGTITNTEDTDKIIIRRDQKSEDANYSGYVEWGGIGNYSCVVQIGDDAGTPALGKQPMVYSSTAINDDCPEVRVMPNNRMYLRTGHVFGAPLTLMGAGYGGEEAASLYLYSSSSGWGGPITLAGDTMVTSRGTDTATTYLNGDISETAGGPKSLTINNVTYSPTTEVAGTNTYTGDTVIRDTDPGGPSYTVILKASGSIATSRMIDIGEYATFDVSEHGGWALGAAVAQVLQGEGAVTGDILGATAGTIAPGSSIGTLSINGNAAVAGTLDIEYDSDTKTIDLLAVTNELDLTGATINFSDLGSRVLAPGAYVFATYGTLVGDPATESGLPAGSWVDYAYEGSSIALVRVPEPSTFILIVAAGLTLAAWRRR